MTTQADGIDDRDDGDGRDGTVVLEARSLVRVYRSGAGDTHACQDVSLEVRAAELLVVTGPSGAGKTTLLNMLGTLDRPTSGSVAIGGVDVASLDQRELATLRRDRLGFVFQSFGLIETLTAAENVEVPLRLRREPAAVRDARVEEVLALVGLEDHARQRVDELSGGQQQRVGIARALAAGPSLLFADEPTGQLDSGNARIVIDLIRDLVRSQGIAAVVATHDPMIVERADRVVRLHDGRIDLRGADG
ncbi:ABC transporter ATP-binding protein [Cellulomonas sp. P24]|uniref:ABC transporter ATP-binding protein n=1 Tax=Cellulomonas sp. P24 TaxID=2885206 RepID=UPI00216B5629|nr:ABC transporter ATP-binding protein [Cellulomonas sp. P24]MCR6493997.1 ABC transporter ATP-binding protein [Cellulomonas sp. P24]